ncbi:hypothetical protein CHI08_13815 [Peribacillus simplex]|nr:hypothetical protein CHI08_13815 [Peribacillus simplex]
MYLKAEKGNEYGSPPEKVSHFSKKEACIFRIVILFLLVVVYYCNSVIFTNSILGKEGWTFC